MADINNPIKYSDLIVPDDSVTKLIAQLEQLTDTYAKLSNNIKSQAGAMSEALRSISGSTEGGRKSISEASQEAEALRRAYEKVRETAGGTADTLVRLKTAQAEHNQLVRFAVDMNKQQEGSHRSLVAAIDESSAKVQALSQVQKEQTRVQKLQAQMMQSAEGSYNRLSAEYRLLKEQINALSGEERRNNAEAKAMVARSKEVYEEMQRLQEATGKHQLNVGNYADAARGLRMELRTLTQQMAAMQLEGKEGSAEYQQMAEKAGKLRDAMSDASQAVSRMASDTSQLDTVMSGMTAASGGFTALTGAMSLFGGESEEVQQAQKTLQSTMAITMGLTQVQNALQRQSALMLGLSKVQTYALAKAEAYERLIKIQGEKATLRATIAQKAFNVVAKANPYVLLAMALVTVVGALYAFAKGNETAAEKQKELNDAERAHLEYLERINSLQVSVSETRIKNLTNELNIAKARNASISEIREIEDRILKERKAQQAKSASLYANEIYNIEIYRKNIKSASDTLEELNRKKQEGFDSKIRINFNGEEMKMKLDEAIEYYQNYIDTQQSKLTIGLQVEQQGKDLAAEEKQKQAERAKEDADRWKAARKAELDAVRSTQKARLDIMDEGYAKQRAKAEADANNEIEDLRNKLRTEENLTARARAAINEQIGLIQKRLTKELEQIERARQQEELQAIRETQAMKIDLMEEGEKKELAQLMAAYEAQDEELQRKLMNDTSLTLTQKQELIKQQELLDEKYERERTEIAAKYDALRLQAAQETTKMRLEMTQEGSDEELRLSLQLIEQQRQAEIAENKTKAEDVRQSELDINAKYDALALQQQGEFYKNRAEREKQLLDTEIDLMDASEQKKERLALKAEKERLEKILKLIRAGMVSATDEEIKQYEAQYKATSKKLGDLTKFGTHATTVEDMKESLQETASYTLEILSTVTEARVKMAEAAVEAANKEVESAKQTLQTEREAAANGYANNQEFAQKQLEAAKENQRKALEEQKKAQKRQQAIDTLTQISSLITASANMWRDLGFPAAIVGIAAMWASFAASKIMGAKLAKQNTEEYGEGTVELLEGGSHASGHDIDLGTKPDGTRRRAEGGEYFAVINKRSSRKYRRTIPNVINALNDGTFGAKYLNAYDAQNNNGVGLAVATASPTDVSTLESEVRKIREQGEYKTYIDPRGNVVIKYKNITQTIKK